MPAIKRRKDSLAGSKEWHVCYIRGSKQHGHSLEYRRTSDDFIEDGKIHTGIN